MNCTELDTESHDLLQRITESGLTKRGWARTTPGNLQAEFQLQWKVTKALLEGLQELGFVALDLNRGQITPLQTCSCVVQPTRVDTGSGEVLSRVARAHAHARPLAPALARTSLPRGKVQDPVLRTGSLPSPSSRETSRFDSPEVQDSGSNAPIGDTSDTSEGVRKARVVHGRRGVQKTRRQDTPRQLSLKLKFSLMAAKRDHGITWTGGINIQAMDRQLSSWLKEGVTPDQIRGMIAVFCANPEAWLRPGVPAWKTFLGERVALHEAVLKLEETERVLDAGATPSDWLGSADPNSEQERWEL